MVRTKVLMFVSFLVVAGMLLAACGPTTPPAPATEPPEVKPTEPPVVEPTEPPVVVEPTEPPPPPPPEAQTYRMGIFADMTTTNYWAYLDPESSVWNAYVLGATGHPAFYTLAYPDIIYAPYMAPDLPAPIEQEGDFYVQTFTCKQGVTWSDGEEVTVHDFIFTVETAGEFGLGGNWLGYLDFDYIHHLEAVDDYTVKVYFSQTVGLSINQMGVGLVPWTPEHFWADVVEEARGSDDPATTLYAADGSAEPSIGAFTFRVWEPGAYAELTANPDSYFANTTHTFYTDGSYKESNANYEYCIYGDCTGDVKFEYTDGPYVANVIYSVYGTQDAAVLALANGEVDFLLNPLGLQRGLREQVVGNPDLGAFQNPSNGFRYLAFNVRKSPNDIKEFRQAVAYLIDKEFITQNVLQGTAIAVYALVPPGNAFWNNPDVPKLGYGMSREERVAKAIELLKSAGFSWDVEPTWEPEEGVVIPGSTLKGPDGVELEEIELLAPSAGYDPMRATAAIWIEQWCSELGIPVKANPTGFNTIIPKIFEPDAETGHIEFDWYILGWSLGNPALPDFFISFFSCDNDAEEFGGSNTPGYCDEDFEVLVTGLQTAQEIDLARDYIFQMDAMICEDVPYVTLFSAPILEFYAKARVEYPFTEALDGLQNLNGMPDAVIVR